MENLNSKDFQQSFQNGKKNLPVVYELCNYRLKMDLYLTNAYIGPMRTESVQKLTNESFVADKFDHVKFNYCKKDG